MIFLFSVGCLCELSKFAFSQSCISFFNTPSMCVQCVHVHAHACMQFVCVCMHVFAYAFH